MPPEFLNSPPSGASTATFVLISMFYLLLLWLVVYMTGREFRLISAGLLTAVAAVGYGTLVWPAGPIYAPYLLTLAFLLVLTGIGMNLLERPRHDAPPQESQHD